VSESRRVLFRDCKAILNADPANEEAQSLVARWRALLEAETGGDEDTKAEIQRAFSGRRNWPVGLKLYRASLYEMDSETWERVTDFIEKANAADTDHL
jgi:hypothetical protein